MIIFLILYGTNEALCIFSQSWLVSKGPSPLHSVSILSRKEAKGTFLTPVRENMNVFLQESFCTVQIKLFINFESFNGSGSALSPCCLHSLLWRDVPDSSARPIISFAD